MNGTPQPPAATSGATIGPYEILEVLQRGGGENSYLAVRESSDHKVVLTVTANRPVQDEDQLAASRLVHRNILRILDTGEHDGLSYVVTERLEGRTLADLLSSASHTLDLTAQIDLVAQLCSGLHFAHQSGFVHGDLKPANVFVTDDGVVKLLNLGAALPAELTVVSDTALSGVEYMAPERLVARDPVDGRSDVFSAGVILYELVAGRRPFHGSTTAMTLARILSDTPPAIDTAPALDAVIRKALEKQPGQRYASAQEFAFALWQLELQPGGALEPPSREGSETVYGEHQRPVAGQSDAPAPWTLELTRETLTYAGIGAGVIVLFAVLIWSC